MPPVCYPQLDVPDAKLPEMGVRSAALTAVQRALAQLDEDSEVDFELSAPTLRTSIFHQYSHAGGAWP